MLEEAEEYKKAADQYEIAFNKEMKTSPIDTLFIVTALDNAGRCYFNLEDYTKALEYYNRALAEGGLSISDTLTAQIFRHKGIAFDWMFKPQEALINYEGALEIFKKYNLEYRVAPILLDIGDIYLQMEEYDNSLESFNQSLSIYEKLKNHCFVKQGNFDISI